MILLTLHSYVTTVTLYMCIPLHPLGHEPHFFCLSVSILLKDSQLLLPRENEHVCSPHGSLNVFPASLVMPRLPWVQ